MINKYNIFKLLMIIMKLDVFIKCKLKNNY